MATVKQRAEAVKPRPSRGKTASPVAQVSAQAESPVAPADPPSLSAPRVTSGGKSGSSAKARAATRPAVQPVAVEGPAQVEPKPKARRQDKPKVEPQAKAQPKPQAKSISTSKAKVKPKGLAASDLAATAPPEPAVVPTKPEVAVFQIYFEPAQRAELEPAFVPYDNSASNDPLLEFAVFERLSRDEGVRLSALWGAVSWRFGRKTGLSGKAWLDEIASHPGFDLYFCNPEPENEGLYANQWHRGITAHPGFRELSSAVLVAAGHEAAHLDAVTPSSVTSSCNYFVGNAAFWSAYIPFVRGIVDSARRTLPPAVLAALDSSRGDPRGLHGGASYWPFIVERLLPLFLRGPGQGLKVCKVALPAADAKLNGHVKRLREMKDVAHRTRSVWLHSCWLHYRNLFLLQAAGKEWCKENLARITPTKDVVFL